MSYFLRHHPDKGGIELDANGWTSVEGLLEALRISGYELSPKDLYEFVKLNGNGRFALSTGGDRIRANYGHSVSIEMKVSTVGPRKMLFHATPERNLFSIFAEGLKPMGRLYVHLSSDLNTALEKGSRHGSPVLLLVDAPAMISAQHSFYRCSNGIWLTKTVPSRFISLAEGPPESRKITLR